MTKETAGVFTEKLLWMLILTLFAVAILPLGFMTVVAIFIFGFFFASSIKASAVMESK